MSFTSSPRRELRLVVGAKAVTLLGDEVATVALMLRLQGQGAGAVAVAALMVANALPIVLLSPVVGRVVDRVDNRRLLLASSLAQALLCVLLALSSGTGAVLALVTALGVGQAVNGATWQALLPAVVPPAELPRAISLAQSATLATGIVAPALSGLLTGWYGPRVPLLVDAATFGVVAVAALLLRVRRSGSVPAGRAHGGLAIVRGDALLRPLFVLLGVFVLIGSMVNVVDVFLIRSTLHASTLWYGVNGACFSVGAVGGALLAGRLRGAPALARGFVVACAVLSVGLVGLALVPAVGWALPAGFVVGAANGVLNVALGSLVMGRAAPSARGRVGALLTGVASGTQLVAFVLGGALAGSLGPRGVFALAGVLGLLAPVLFGPAVLRGAAAGAADGVQDQVVTVSEGVAA